MILCGDWRGTCSGYGGIVWVVGASGRGWQLVWNEAKDRMDGSGREWGVYIALVQAAWDVCRKEE